MHYQTIINDALEGQSETLRAMPAARLDWAGSEMILELFDRTSGQDRAAFIDAIGQVIEHHPASPAAIAELIHIASGLDLAQVEPQVRKLGTQAFGAQNYVKEAIANFLALRDMSTVVETPVPSMLRANKSTTEPKNGKANKAATLGSAKKRTFPRKAPGR